MTLESKSQLRYPFIALLIIGIFGLYPLLTILCAKAGGVDWTLYATSGECWSEANGTYLRLGVATGLFIGVGLMGSIVSHLVYKNHPIEQHQDDTNAESTIYNDMNRVTRMHDSRV
mmetsp:Transcript_3782/g.4315  ORF Transcript_3782/g.4315 Transcript_3782/m.4315 type:complete len:116 (-) Transcript_3782:84-431(-)